jgi:hypothetical protein
MILDVALAKVETEKRGSLIKAWEENEKAKAENKYVINHFILQCDYQLAAGILYSYF